MSKESQEIVTVDEELSFLHNYIEVLEIRYGHNLKVDITVSDNVGQRNLVPFTLQLLLENVIKHNVISSSHPMVVAITLDNDGVKVENPVKLLKSSTSLNVGGKYLSKLYRLYGAKFNAAMDGDRFIAQLTYLS